MFYAKTTASLQREHCCQGAQNGAGAGGWGLGLTDRFNPRRQFFTAPCGRGPAVPWDRSQTRSQIEKPTRRHTGNMFPPSRGGEDGCGPTRLEGLQSLNCYLCVYGSVSPFGCVFVMVRVSASVSAIRNACVHVIISVSASRPVPMPLCDFSCV